MISISPGHWLPGTGAKDIIDEVTEARKVAKRVTEILRATGIAVNYIEDNVSKSQAQNLTYLVSQHNKSTRQFDVSIHFNASAGRQNRGIGTEVLYYDQQTLAAKVSKAMSSATGLIDRGAKQRKKLAFLANTNKAAILLEVCFVNSTVDVAIYKRDFEKLCQAIANELATAVGKSIKEQNVVTNEMKFSSPTLKAETETTLASKICRQIIVDAAIDAGANKSVWQKKLDDGTITDADLLGLSAKVVVGINKKQ
ncbi:N-acetylmuramoyl-L-alanine amidase [Solibacillus sp. CAU 1738]|uniref:N-acetylmuramoyl-L-alanine amidase n=1 Tax=Solibacillus sp. CAU 1738 TaxID=3140363 RepID=UPI003261080A